MSTVLWKAEEAQVTREALAAGVWFESHQVVGALSRFSLHLKAQPTAAGDRKPGDVAAFVYIAMPAGYAEVRIKGALGVVNSNGNLAQKLPLDATWTTSDRGFGSSSWITQEKLQRLKDAQRGDVTFRLDIREVNVKHNESYMLSQLYESVCKPEGRPVSESATLALSVRQLLAESHKLKEVAAEREVRWEKEKEELQTRLALAQSSAEDKAAVPPSLLGKRRREEVVGDLERDAAGFVPDGYDRPALKRLQLTLQKAAARVGEVLEKDDQCSICLDRFKTHTLNPCGHSFCAPCLDAVEAQGSERKCVQCAQVYSTKIKMH